MAISHQRTPQNGWRYKQPRTETTIITTDWDSLVRAVTDHRRSNGIDVGDVIGDIDMQIAVNHPELVL